MGGASDAKFRALLDAIHAAEPPELEKALTVPSASRVNTRSPKTIGLAVRRPTVSLIAYGLQQAGLIRYQRGKIAILTIDVPGGNSPSTAIL